MHTASFMLKVCCFCLLCWLRESKTRGKTIESDREREREKERGKKRELSHRAAPRGAAVALPDFPLIAFSWYLNPGPFGFWRPAQTPQSPQRPIQLPDPSLTPRRG